MNFEVGIVVGVVVIVLIAALGVSTGIFYIRLSESKGNLKSCEGLLTEVEELRQEVAACATTPSCPPCVQSPPPSKGGGLGGSSIALIVIGSLLAAAFLYAKLGPKGVSDGVSAKKDPEDYVFLKQGSAASPPPVPSVLVAQGRPVSMLEAENVQEARILDPFPVQPRSSLPS